VTTVLTAKIIALDKNLNYYFTTYRKPRLLKIMGIITHLGSGAFWAIVYAFTLLFFQGLPGTLIKSILAAELICLVTIIVLRYLTRRERPRLYLTRPTWTPWNQYSFPSHHVARMFMLAILIGTHYRELLLFMLSAAIAIGFTRIFLEKHYLSDVLAGATLGGLAALVCLSL
jgi:undecaprenyl-diphosphatase